MNYNNNGLRTPTPMEKRLIEEIKRLRVISCRGEDPTCPCRDGDACHYRGADAWKTPLEVEVERLRAEVERLNSELFEAEETLHIYRQRKGDLK